MTEHEFGSLKAGDRIKFVGDPAKHLHLERPLVNGKVYAARGDAWKQTSIKGATYSRLWLTYQTVYTGNTWEEVAGSYWDPKRNAVTTFEDWELVEKRSIQIQDRKELRMLSNRLATSRSEIEQQFKNHQTWIGYCLDSFKTENVVSFTKDLSPQDKKIYKFIMQFETLEKLMDQLKEDE